MSHSSNISQVVVITGAGAGIGFALCQAYAQAGAIVALNDLSPSIAKRAAEQINAEVQREAVMALPFDVADVPAVRQAVGDVALRFGRVDVAIANAGLTNYGAFLDYTPEAFDRLTSVNLRGSYFFAQAAAREMVARNQPGRIVLMSSATGNRAFLNLSAYGTTKAGLQHMARTLALELGPYNITVNAIAPGAILTERTLKDDPMFAENWAGVTPIKRSGTVEDVAAMVQFLTSPAAQFVNGQTLIIDGGWSLSSPLPEEHPEQPDAGSKLV